MAQVLNNNNKYSLKFNASASDGTDGSTRTISGLNIGGGSQSDNGPILGSALTNFIPRFMAFSNGTFSNWRWVTEQEVVL